MRKVRLVPIGMIGAALLLVGLPAGAVTICDAVGTAAGDGLMRHQKRHRARARQ